MMDQALYNQRLERFKNVILLEQPDAIPVINPFTPDFALDYAGYPLTTGMWDVNKVIDSLHHVFRDFDYDVYNKFLWRAPQFYASLGAKTFVQSETGFMQHPEVHGLEAEEYPEFIANPLKTIIEKVLPRLYTEFQKPSPYNMVAFAKGMMTHTNTIGRYFARLNEIEETYSTPFITSGTIFAPFDFLADILRSFSGISMDVRRRPQEVQEACEVCLSLVLKKALMSAPPSIDKMVFIPLHMAPFLRTSDFEKLYWPTFKKMCEELISNGRFLSIFFEGDWTRFLDHIQELPAKKILARFEYGDPKLYKEKLGKVMCLTGFYPLSLLKNGTKAECIDKTKELVEVLAHNGGFLFSPDKIILKKDDINIDNYHAVIDYLRKEGRY